MATSDLGSGLGDGPSVDVPSDPAARRRLLESISPVTARQHHALLRGLLEAEARQRVEVDDHEFYENLYWCAFLLFCVGDPADVPALWRAKQIDFDTAIGLDTQTLFGAGVDVTLDWLAKNGHQDLAEELAPQAANFDPDLPDWRASREHYFYA